MEPPQVVVEWGAEEYEFVPKTKAWYWSVGILSVGCALAAFIAANILFGIILLLAGGSVALLGSRRPALHRFRITDRGIHVSEQVFPYQNIERFAIEEAEPKRLIFEISEGFVRVITIPLLGADQQQVRTALKNRGKEEVETLDTFVARFSDWMGIG